MKRETFTEDEARQILARASERQEALERGRLASGEGVSLAELKDIAEEVGIEASHVQAAAGELVLREGTPLPATRYGLATELSEMRMLPGTVSDRQWERMVGVFREAFGRAGMTTGFGDVREWVSTNDTADGMPVRIRLEPGEDGTLMEMEQSTEAIMKIGLALFGSFGAISVGLGGLLAIGSFEPSLWAIPGMLAGLAGMSGVGSWLSGRSFLRKRSELFESVADKVELIGRPEDP